MIKIPRTGSKKRDILHYAWVIQVKEHHRCLYLNSPPMVAGLCSYLFAGDIDVPKEIRKGTLILSSDTEHLHNGRFDIDRMLGLLTGAVHQALKDGYRGLWATGDMSWEFGPEKNFSKLEEAPKSGPEYRLLTAEYEWRLEELFYKLPTLSGLCQYHRDTLPPAVVGQGLMTHQALFVNETLSRFNPDYIRPEDLNAYSEG